MTGVLSGLALVGAFGAVAALATILAARLYRAGSPRRPAVGAGRDMASAPAPDSQTSRHR
jgi:hypothetical protein